MKRLKSIVMACLLAIILSIATTCFAETKPIPEEWLRATPYAINTTEETQNVVNDDLYLSGNDITMDQIVNGNVYILGNNVTITGEVSGNLFICAKNVNFEEASYIEGSTYIVSNNINFNSLTSSLYTVCHNLTIPEGCGAYNDLYSLTNKITLLGSIGRNAYIRTSEFIMSSDSSQGSISGKLTYSSENEISFPEGAIVEDINYMKLASTNNAGTTIWNIICNIVNSILAASLVYLLYRFFLESSLEKASSCLSHKFGKVLLTGLVSLIAIPILSVVLITAQISFTAGILLLMLYTFMIGISPYIFASILARRIYNNKKFSKMPLEYLLAILIAVVISALKMIPFVGIVVTIFISILGFGIIIYNLFFANHQKNN